MTRGIDIRESSGQIVFRASLKSSAGAKVATGTTEIRLYEVQDNGALKTYDFSDDTFKTTACTDDEQEMTHRAANNGSVDTGLWTYVLSTLTGFTVGGVYVVQVTNSGASPESQEREFQFGGVEGNQSELTQQQAKAAVAAAISESGLTGTSGPVSVTITVTDGTTPLPNVEVAVYDAGVLSGTGATDVDGEVKNLGLANGTYDVVLYHAGYTSTSQQLTVPDDGDPEYALTAATVTGSTDPVWCHVYADVFDDSGQLEPGALVSLRIIKEPTGSGHVFGGGIATETADANGRVAWAGNRRLPVGCQIEYWRGAADADPKRVKKATIAATSVVSGSFWLPKLVGM